MYDKAFKNARIFQKKSLQNFATPLNVSKQYIWKIEQGIKTPSLDLLKKLEAVTGFSVWALATGDFERENQHLYLKLSNQNFTTMPVNLNEYSVVDRNFFVKKLEVEIDEIREQTAQSKGALAKRLERSSLSEGELNNLEAEVEKAKAVLAHLTNTNAAASMVTDQRGAVAKAETELSERKRKGGIISDREAFLEELMIEELELKIKLREDKIAALKAIAN
jgi:transcriptional regulator with XRE-family HTH domain